MLDLLDMVHGIGFSTRYKGAMIEMSHAIEDVAQEAGPGTRLYANFQLASLYRPEAVRYDALVDQDVQPVAWFVPDVPIQARHPVLALAPGDPWTAGWWVVATGPAVQVALVAEDIDGVHAPQDRRRFRGILTFDPHVIDRLEARLLQAAGHEPRPQPDAGDVQRRMELNARVASRLADYLDRARRREREQANLKEALASTIVHDLRNPLQAVIGWAEFLRRDQLGPGPAAWNEALQAIDEAGHDLDRMIGTILDAFKLEDGAMKLRASRVEARNLLSRIAERHHSPFVPPLVVANDGEVPPLWVDADLVDRAMGNLIGNATKYGGGTTITLSARAERPGFVALRVADEGPGLPPESLTTLFERYAQLVGGQVRQGSGLGLYFCRLVAEAHGGHIEASNAPTGGAQFDLYLPAAP